MKFRTNGFEERAVLGCCAVWVVNGLPQFRINLPRSSSDYERYESIHGLITLKKQAVCFFETSEVNYPTTWCKNPKELLLYYKNRFAANKSLSALYYF
jgi:hypothetical protein